MVNLLNIYIRLDINYYKGVAYFNNLIIGASPNSFLYLLISSNSLENYCGNLPNLNLKTLAINNGCFLALKIHMRQCIFGEMFLKEINMY